MLNGPLGSAALMVTQTSYDALNRPQCTAVRENAAVFASLPPSACTQSTAGPYGPDHVVQFAYDLAGQKLTEQRGVGTGSLITYATYAYGLDGEVATVKDANGNLTTNTYDGFNRLKQVNFPVTALGANASDPANFEAYTFDAAGNRLTLRKRDAGVIGLAYDALNRPTAKTFAANPAVNVAYAYDLAGRPVSALYPNQANLGVAWTYDAAGRRITEATNGRALSFAYDAAGNPKTLTWPDGAQTAYAFDTANRLTSIGAGGVNVTPGYDGLSRMTSVARAGSSSTVGFDYADRMASLAHAFNPSTGNQTWGFTFTPAGQLVAATTTNPAYDWTGGGASTVNTAADGLNRDAAIAAVGAPCGATNAGYDCNGNLTYDGTRRFTYDAENRLTGETGPVTMSVAYDPTGRLQQTIVNGATTQFLYEGDALVAEYDGSNNILRRYVHGPSVDNPVVWFEGSAVGTANASYLIADRQGSIVATANTVGAVTANLTYDAYGVPNAWGGSRFRYTGQIELPEAGLYYYKARVYDPASGRFLQTDPVGYKDDLDLYAYVANDPVNGSDPNGECGGGVGNNPCGGLEGLEGMQGQQADATRIDSTSNITVAASTSQNGPGANQAPSGGKNAKQPSGGGRVGPADGSGHSTLSPDRGPEQQKADFNNPKLNGIPEVERQEAVGMVAVPAAGMAAGAAVVAAPEVAAATGRALGPRGSIIGREFLGGKAIITGRNLRFGWGWNGPKGVQQLRLSGKWIFKVFGVKHIDLPFILRDW